MSEKRELPTITIIGSGYVGVTSAAVFANAGYTVYVLDINPSRLAALKKGESFFYENHLNPLLKEAVDAKRLIPTDSYADSIPKSDIVFSCVGTPDNADGSSNLSYVFSAAEETAKYAQPNLIYVQKSTVPVGTGLKIQERFAKLRKKSIAYVSNPEFLREGTAISDTLFFDRVVVGGDDRQVVDTVLDVYKNVENWRDQIAHLARIPVAARGDQYIATSLNSAELIKVTANAFLALKISFANSIAMLADQAGADIIEVMDAVGADSRIGRSFLNAGRGYGGGCFPKDVSGLISSGIEYGVDLEIMNAAQLQNEKMPGYIVDKLQDAFGEQLKNKNIAVLGLAFKAGTSDVRKSPGLAIVDKLIEAGATVTAYDPQANDEAKEAIRDGARLVESIDDAIEQSDAIIIATEWPEILSYPANSFAAHMNGKFLFDAVNQYDALSANDVGLAYIGVGHTA